MESCKCAKQLAYKILRDLSCSGVSRDNIYKLYQSSIMKAALISADVPEKLREEVKQELLAALSQIARL